MVKLTKSIEDYLESIYLIQKDMGVVRVRKIAKFLNVSLPSVSATIKKLNKAKLVENEKYGYIKLTKQGKILAQEVYMKHKIILDFLTNVLKVDEKKALEEACAIEHCLSKETTQKLKKFTNQSLKKIKGGR